MITHKTAKTLFALFAALFLTFAVAGQEATPEPEMTETVDMDNGDAETGMTDGLPNATTTLEEIAGNASEFYGQQVTIEGGVEAFLNAKTFVLGEEALLDNDQVLVLNMTDQHFDVRVTNDADLVVTGTILPSRSERMEGVSELDFWDPIDVPESAVNPALYVDPLAFYYDGGLADGYDVYTVLVVEDVNSIAISFQELDDVDEFGDADGLDEDEIDDTEDMDTEATEEVDG